MNIVLLYNICICISFQIKEGINLSNGNLIKENNKNKIFQNLQYIRNLENSDQVISDTIEIGEITFPYIIPAHNDTSEENYTDSFESKESSIITELPDNIGPTETTEIIEPTNPIKYEPISINYYASIHILSFNYFRYFIISSRPILLQFNVIIYYKRYSPFPKISFTLRIISTNLRNLQENQTYSIATCFYKSIDHSTNITLYDCESETENIPNIVESLNDFKFQFENGTTINYLSNKNEIEFSIQAAEASKNILIEKLKITSAVFLSEGKVFNNDTTLFFIKGRLEGDNSELVSLEDKITFTFYDTSQNVIRAVNVECDILNKIIDDFQIRCQPNQNLTAHIYEANGTVDDIGIYLIMDENYDYVNIIKYENNVDLIKKSSSSGLPGGAIAGIIIACILFILIITVLVLYLKNSKTNNNNGGSMIIQLKSVENY